MSVYRTIGPTLVLASGLDDCHVKICKFTALSSGSFCQIYRVTDEALIAETAIWPFL